MALFFFDFRQGQERVRDPEGAEFASVEEAFLDCARAAQEMWSELLKDRRDPRQCSFEVRDAENNVMFVFPFQEALDVCTDRKPSSINLTFHQAFAIANRATRVGEDFRKELWQLRAALWESRSLLEQSREIQKDRELSTTEDGVTT